MKHPRSRLACALLLLFAVGCFLRTPLSAARATASVPSLSAESALLMEAETERVLFETNAHARMGMASTTKIMTALLVAERMDPDTVVTVPREAVGIEGSSIYLTAGERLTVRELLYALMLASANDAATALAIATAGNVEAFCVLMNRRAQELGLTDTHFVNPHGLASEEHYTTAYDLARIAAEALRHPLICEIAASKRAEISFGDHPKGRYLRNHNRLLTQYDGAIGLKTGFTKKTGRCLVSAAERDGMTLIAVTLNAPDDWKDHTAMLDYGFAAYTHVTLYEVGTLMIHLPLSGGKDSYVTLTNTKPIRMLLPTGEQTPTLRVESPSHFALAPVARDTELGRVICTVGETSVSSPLVACADATAYEEPKGFWERLLDGILSRLKNFFTIFQTKD